MNEQEQLQREYGGTVIATLLDFADELPEHKPVASYTESDLESCPSVCMAHFQCPHRDRADIVITCGHVLTGKEQLVRN